MTVTAGEAGETRNELAELVLPKKLPVGSVVLDDRESMLKRGMARAIRKETRQALHKSTMDKSPVAKSRQRSGAGSEPDGSEQTGVPHEFAGDIDLEAKIDAMHEQIQSEHQISSLLRRSRSHPQLAHLIR